MTNGTDEAIRKILEDETIPQQVTNKLLLGVMLQIRSDFNQYREERRVSDKSAEILDRLEDVEEVQRLIQREMRDNPSILWLIRYEPRKTIATIMLLFAVLTLLNAAANPIMAAILALLGV